MERKVTVLAFLGITLLSFVIPASAQSNLSDSYNQLFFLLTLVSAAVLLLVLTLWAYFMYQFRESNEEVERTPISHATARKLEVGWTLVAIFIVVILMVVSYPPLFGETNAAERDLVGEEIVVEGTGSWEWIYHLQEGSEAAELNNATEIGVETINGQRTTNIKLEVGTWYTFTFYNSGPYIHSYYVPDLNIKMDVVPGTNNTYSFQITEPGEYQLLCAEYCGALHSEMRGFIFAEA